MTAAALLEELDPSRPPAPDQTPWMIGSYLVEGEIGRGGLARVLLAHHVHPQFAERQVALKVLHPEVARDREADQRFVAEAGLLANLRHPNIVRTFEAGVDDGHTFLVMEHVPGCNLDQLLRLSHAAGRTLPRPLLVHACGEVLAGLTYAHELCGAGGEPLRIIHHDLSPVNVLVSTKGEIKLADFGIASWAAARPHQGPGLFGKLGRFAPEQLADESVDHRADLFAVGVILFELLTGRLPFVGAAERETMELNMRAALPPAPFLPENDHELEAIVRRALARDPRRRFASARAMRDALGPWLVSTADGAELAAAAVRGLFGPGVARIQPVGPERRRAATVTRVLLVTRDRQLAADLALRLTHWHLRVDVAGSAPAAGALLRRYTCRAAVVDAGALSPFEAAQVVQALRSAPGMGAIPVVLLGLATGTPKLRPVNSTSLAHAAAAAEIAAALEQLLARNRGQRAFPRYVARHPVSVRYQGRAHPALTEDVSRTGLRVRCDCLPPCDELVHVTLTTSDGSLCISGVVRVAHVEPRDEESLRFALGLEWVELNSTSEAQLIELVATRAAFAARRG